MFAWLRAPWHRTAQYESHLAACPPPGLPATLALPVNKYAGELENAQIRLAGLDDDSHLLCGGREPGLVPPGENRVGTR